jgi:predicted alpha/beta hydrolase family esterase
LKVFEAEVLPLTRDDVLVGHSIGAGFLVRALERFSPEGSAVRATLLVSSFMSLLDNDEFDPINRTIVEGDCDWAVVANRAGKVRVWHDSDDPYVPESLGREVANHLRGNFVVLHHAGHVNKGSGYEQFPELVSFIESL